MDANWLRVTGKDNWLPVTASVYSCEYTDLPNQSGGAVGHYHVAYTYEVAGERYTGRFVDFGRADETYLKRNDKLIVKYDPHAPQRSYYPDLRTQTKFRFKGALIGAGLGIIVLITYIISTYRR